MNITIDSIEKVMNEANVDYKTAKEALLACDGDPDIAIANLQPEVVDEDGNRVDKQKIDQIIDKVKELIRKGNVDRIQITRKGETLLSIPVSVGVIGGLIGLSAAPAAMIAAAIAGFGFDCRISVVKKDGSTEDFSAED